MHILLKSSINGSFSLSFNDIAIIIKNSHISSLHGSEQILLISDSKIRNNSLKGA